MTTRHRVTAAAAAGLLTLLTAACGQSVPDHSPAELRGQGEITGDIRFSWWGSASRNERTNAVADMFEEEFAGTNVKREAADFGNYFKRLNVQGAGKNMPCVTQLQARTLGDFTERDALLPLDPMIESGAIDVSHIPEAVLDTGRGPDGKLYMLPTGAAYDALMVNESLAEQAGAPLPEPGYDWEDYVDFLRRAEAGGLPEDVAPTALRGGLPNFFIAYVQGRGETMFDGNQLGFSRELLTEYWQMWQDINEEGLTNSPAAIAEEPPSPEAGYLAQGKVLSDNRPGNALTPAQGTLDGQGEGQRLTTLPLPSGPEGPGNVLITSGMSIPRNCANLPTAAAFLDFWANDPRSGDTYASDNGAVTNTQLLQRQLDDPDLPELKKQELRLYQEIVELDPPNVIYPPGYMAVFESGFGRAWEDVAFGNASIPDAVDTFFEEANAGLAT